MLKENNWIAFSLGVCFVAALIIACTDWSFNKEKVLTDEHVERIEQKRNISSNKVAENTYGELKKKNDKSIEDWNRTHDIKFIWKRDLNIGDVTLIDPEISIKDR